MMIQHNPPAQILGSGAERLEQLKDIPCSKNPYPWEGFTPPPTPALEDTPLALRSTVKLGRWME